MVGKDYRLNFDDRKILFKRAPYFQKAAWRIRQMRLIRLMKMMAVFILIFLLADKASVAQAAAKRGDAGAQLFGDNCAYCHGADGNGGRGPAIATHPRVIAMTDEELINIVHNGAGNGAMPAFPDLGDVRTQAVVRYLRKLQGVSGAVAGEKLTGDAVAGKAVYFGKGQCSSCHMVNGEGGFIAPDLTTYGQSRAASEVLQAILKPDAQLSPGAKVVEVKTKSGVKISGVVRSEDNINITLLSEDGRYHFLTRSNLASVNFTDHSLMPDDYGTRLTAKELDDVVSFLIVTGKNAPVEVAPSGRRRHGGN